MPVADARALLRAILGATASDAELDLLAERCGQLPLALRVAATFLALHPNWSVTEYVTALSEAGERLELLRIEGTATLDVAAVLGLSASDLARELPALAEQWQRLAVFPGRFDTMAAAAVWDVPLNDARAALGELLRRAMVRFDPPSQRYHLHALMLDLARLPLCATHRPADLAAVARRLKTAATRHAAYFQWLLARAEQLYLQGGGAMLEGLRMFDLERRQIAAGYAFALAHAGEATGDRLLAAYGEAAPYMVNLRLHARERVAWHEAAVAACRRLGERAAEGGRLTNLGNAYADCGDVAGAIRCYEQAVAIARELRDRQQESVRLGNLGGAYADLGEPRRAIGCFADALVLARLCGDLRAEASHQGNLAAAYLTLGRQRAALQCGRRALACAQKVGDRRGEGVYRANLASVHLCLDEVERAIALYREALAIAAEIGDRRGQGYRAGNLALALDENGEPTGAAELARQALELLEELEEEPARQLRQILVERFAPVRPIDPPQRGLLSRAPAGRPERVPGRASRRCSGSVSGAEDGEDVGIFQRGRLVHIDRAQPRCRQQSRGRLDPVVEIMDLDHHLLDLRPVFAVDPLQHVELGLLDVHLQQVDTVDTAFRDDFREGPHPQAAVTGTSALLRAYLTKVREFVAEPNAGTAMQEELPQGASGG